MRRWVLIVIVLVLVAAGATVYVLYRTLTHHDAHQQPPCCKLQTVRLAVSSENVPFFKDSRVQAVFRAHGFDVEVTKFGSLQMCGTSFGNYDAAVVSSTIVAQQLENCAPMLANQTEITLFRSPLAIATYLPIAKCMQQLRIAQFSDGFWRFDLMKYIAAVQNGMSWSQCGNSVAPLKDRIFVSTTNPRCSNSGEMFLGDVSYVANKGAPVADPKTAQSVGEQIAPLFGDQGGSMEVTTEVLFQDYLTQGMTFTPMALIYEAEFIGEEISQPEHIKQGMLLMYPTRDVFAQRVLIPVQGPKGQLVETIGGLLNEQPLVQDAQEWYGFRYTNSSDFQAIVGKHSIFGKRITAPGDLQEGIPPPPDILKDLVNVASPIYPDSTSSASPNSAPAC
jgi:hypothetical protein